MPLLGQSAIFDFQFYVEMGKLNNGGGGVEWRF